MDLAAQVSMCVFVSLLVMRNSEVFETAYFIEKVDKFFNCLNVSNFTQGKHSRKPFQEPYRNADEFVLASYFLVLEGFLTFLAWQTSVETSLRDTKSA